jgi:hypothetical protein
VRHGASRPVKFGLLRLSLNLLLRLAQIVVGGGAFVLDRLAGLLLQLLGGGRQGLGQSGKAQKRQDKAESADLFHHSTITDSREPCSLRSNI